MSIASPELATGHFFIIDDIAVAMLIGAIVGGVSAGIQTNWDIGAMMTGAIVGAAAGAVGFGAGGWAANSGLGTAIGSNLAGGLVGGAAAGATAGFLGTMANGGGKFFKNTVNGAFFGAVAGAVTGGMLDLQFIEINDVVASMAGAFTSGIMRGGFDDGFIAMAYAAGAATISYVVRGSIGEVRPKSEEIKLYASNDSNSMNDISSVNEDVRASKVLVKAKGPAGYRNGRKWGEYEMTAMTDDGLTVSAAETKVAAGRPWPASDTLYGQNDQSILGAAGMPFSEAFVVNPTSLIDNLIYHESLINAAQEVINGAN